MSAEINRRSWISDLVPPHERGKFFARRVMIGTLVTMSVTLGGARFLDYMSGGSFQDFLDGKGTCPLAGLQIVVAFGGLAGIIGWVLLTQAYEPPLPTPRRMVGLWRSLALPWLRPRFRGLLLQGAMWSLAVGFAADFFNLYMIRDLRMSLLHVSMVNTAGDLAAVLLAPAFGAWADRAGSRKVLEAGIVIKTLLPLAWIGISANHWQWAFAVTMCNMVNSAMTICWMRLSLNMAPRENQTAFLSMHQAVMGAFTGIGALVGGFIATLLQAVAMPAVWGVQLSPLHVLFLISAALRLISLPMMRMVREPRGAILREAGVVDPPGK
jgi:MFS family permease